MSTPQFPQFQYDYNETQWHAEEILNNNAGGCFVSILTCEAPVETSTRIISQNTDYCWKDEKIRKKKEDDISGSFIKHFFFIL